jgi:hypothetical protein
MRLEYSIDLGTIDVPRFSVEAVEGIGKLFTLSTLMLNVMDTRPKVEIVFHGLNPEDPERKITAFKEIVCSAESAPALSFAAGKGGRVPGSSSYFQWLTVIRDDKV